MSFKQRVEKPVSTVPPQPDGACHAWGCPLTGTISPNTREDGPWFCRFHANTEATTWGETTHRIRRDGLKDAPLAGLKITMTPDEARAYVKAIRGKGFFDGPGKAWAYALKAREEAGEQLHPAQRDAWRSALRGEFEHDDAAAELAAERRAIQLEGRTA